MNDPLGSGKIEQISIDEVIDNSAISNIFLSNLDYFKSYSLKSKDAYANELVHNFLINKKFNFPIHKHMEIFVLKNQKDINKIIKYMIFRYKFYLAGKKKINFGYPPYLLIEPVSTCNLRCPFCFQTDKSFTKKPFMGVIDFEFFKKVVDQADELGTGAVTIASRGEPTMHKKYAQMLEYLNKKSNI